MINIIIALVLAMLIRAVIMAYKYVTLQEAIYKYRMYCIKHWEKANVDFSDMIRYKKLFFRVWAWRYTSILPKEKFEIVKTYMK